MVLDFQGYDADKLPPQNIEAEEAILGGILLDPEAMNRVVEVLTAEAFYVQTHQTIFQAAEGLHSVGQPTDLISVTAWLRDRDLLEKVGGQSKLAQLVDRTVSAVNIDQYAALVMDKYFRRQLIQAGQEITGLGYQAATPLETVLDQAEQKIFSITQKRPQQDLVPLFETLIHAFQELEAQIETQAQPGFLSGFYDLDAMTGGFQTSDLIIVAGRPSMGKCLHERSQVLLTDGSLVTMGELYRRRQGTVLTLGNHWRFQQTQVSDFIDDGVKPIFRVTTRLGRQIETTLTHPYLTVTGWKPLASLAVGDRIAVPRRLEVFGDEPLPEHQIKLLAYLIGDGTLTSGTPRFTNGNSNIQQDFIEAVEQFPGMTVHQQHSGGTRTPSFLTVCDPQQMAANRVRFATGLRDALAQYPGSARQLAAQIGVSPALVSLWKSKNLSPSLEVSDRLFQHLEASPDFNPDIVTNLRRVSQNRIKCWLDTLGLWGKNAHQKTIPEVIFKLPKPQLALFLNRLFATDGWAAVLNSGQCQLGYLSVHEVLARQIQHLLVRFGIIAALKHRQVRYKDERRPAWQLDITHVQSIRRFIDEIGIFSKEEAIERVRQSLATRREQSKLAIALDNPDLQHLADSDVYWDEITAIEELGEAQVYDLTIPETHNFVANDICVHNTAFSLNIARNLANSYKLPVAVFSLEMSKEQLVQRLLASDSGIESNRLRAGRVSQNEWEPLSRALASLSEIPIFIDDTANITVTEMRSKCRRLQAEQGKPLGLVLLDYLQLMEGAGDNRVQELSRITRSLKGLARELNVPVIALSQLSRGVEARNNKRPMMSDLRESGSIEQDADLVAMLYRDEYYNPDTPDRGITELIIAKHRNGPTGIVKLLFDPQYTRFRNLANPGRPLAGGSYGQLPPG
ncbi:replicative DNA helicase [Phormidium willei BDU 130791]|nr:replicative DNA helicase [Phormidium willei BDU 130791]